jgi:hypothetical protein
VAGCSCCACCLRNNAAASTCCYDCLSIIDGQLSFQTNNKRDDLKVNIQNIQCNDDELTHKRFAVKADELSSWGGITSLDVRALNYKPLVMSVRVYLSRAF